MWIQTQTFYKPNSLENRSAKNNRKRKMIWFNPPYSKSVSTNVGKIS